MSVSLRFALAASMSAFAVSHAAAPDGAALYAQRCAVCHDNQQMRQTDQGARMPPKSDMAQRTPEILLEAMTKGKMVEQSKGLTPDEMRSIARHVTAKEFNSPALTAGIEEQGKCKGAPTTLKLQGPVWNGWGFDNDNSRYQPTPGIKPADVPRLKLKWAFGFPNTAVAYSQPSIAAGRVFVGSFPGKVYSLDAQTGCIWWTFDAKSAVRTAPLIESVGKRMMVFIGDEKANVIALDAATGAEIWKLKVDDHPIARITGGVRFHKGRLLVPVSSVEETMGGNAKYECCKFRGSVAALDAATGKQLWKTHAITDPPKPYRKNSEGVQMHGPAGAAVWNAPTIDLKRNVLYIGTGNSYTDVDAGTEDSIIAIDLDTGSIKWAKRVTPNDNFMVGCAPGIRNCPQQFGPDYDFGASPILRTTARGKQVILAGQKSGIMYALDPDKRGEILWQTRVGIGSALGGIQWGPAADKTAVYVAVSDLLVRPPDVPGGISALNIETGAKIWSTPAPKVTCSFQGGRCVGAQSAAVSVIPGAVFSGAMDGHIRAYSTSDGAVIWDFDTGIAFETVNGVKAKGGAIDGAGPTIAGGMMLTNSGYARFGGAGGNVLLAFTVDGK